MENTQAIALMIGLAFVGLVIGVCIDLYRHRNLITRDTPVTPDAVFADTPVVKNKGGRPKGSKNKKKRAPNKKARRRQ